MALPSVDCFFGLDLADQAMWIYAGLLAVTLTGDLPEAECFRGQDQRQQLTDIYSAILGISSASDIDGGSP